MARLAKARYTREFKVHAASMAEDEGLGIAETARRLSICPTPTANWVKLAQEGRDFTKQSAVSEIDTENSRLRKENARLRMECEILKKAAAYFAGRSYENTTETIIPALCPFFWCRPPKGYQKSSFVAANK